MESEHFDIIIIGAGIAGTGLAYNLKKENFDGKILIIEKESIGANAAYGYRNTFTKIIKEYGLPYEKKFKSILFGTYKGIFANLPSDFHFINYKKTCEHLLKNSSAILRQETAIDIKQSTLITNKKTYKFKFLIDCSGKNFFIKNRLNHSLPIRYWIGKTFVLNKKLPNQESYYHIINQEGFLEDIYPLKEKTLMGIWKYSSTKNNYNYPQSKISKNLFGKIKIKTSQDVLIPCSPALPIVIKNIALLGDSFGNSSTSTAEGIKPILDTSKILAKNIKNNTLKKYEKEWKSKYLESYILQLATKIKYKDRYTILKILGKNKKAFLEIAKSESNKIPTNLLIKIPIETILSVIKNYALLKLYYRHMKKSSIYNQQKYSL